MRDSHGYGLLVVGVLFSVGGVIAAYYAAEETLVGATLLTWAVSEQWSASLTCPNGHTKRKSADPHHRYATLACFRSISPCTTFSSASCRRLRMPSATARSKISDGRAWVWISGRTLRLFCRIS